MTGHLTRRNQDGIRSAREFWGEFPIKDKREGTRLVMKSFQIAMQGLVPVKGGKKGRIG